LRNLANRKEPQRTDRAKSTTCLARRKQIYIGNINENKLLKNIQVQYNHIETQKNIYNKFFSK